MAVVALWIEYDGGAYVGWQRQKNGISVQQRVEEALAQVCAAPVVVYSSGRTDAGVHARGMVVHFKVTQLLPLSAYQHGVNDHLPQDIAVTDVRQVSDQFHARFSAQGKWYRYSIYLAPVRSPIHKRYSWQFRKPLDLALMRQAAKFFVGEHDFAAFRGAGCNARTTLRRIDSIELIEEGRQLHIDVRGSGFLRHMVRLMVGTLVQIGVGKRDIGEVSRLLSLGIAEDSRLKAPAHGLCLRQVDYPQELLVLPAQTHIDMVPRKVPDRAG
jgi:tRNA pseudouridine38-40 synthase